MPKALNKIPKALNKIPMALKIKPKTDFYIYSMSPMGHRKLKCKAGVKSKWQCVFCRIYGQ